MADETFDAIVIGGGLVGAACADALAGKGVRVAVLDAGPFVGEASWAGAGILHPIHPWSYPESLHPMLRLAASTFLLFDRQAVITDTQRTVGDYLAMGLPVNESSLHFKLEDRWVHALDLRTVGRSEWRNRVTAGYFRLMGFRTLRHVGTADHLHVSLPIPGK